MKSLSRFGSVIKIADSDIKTTFLILKKQDSVINETDLVITKVYSELALLTQG